MHRIATTALLVLTGIVSVADAQSEPDASPIDVQIGRAGIDRYQRGKWSVVGVRGTNATETDQDVVVSVYLDRDSRARFGRRFWIPGRAVRKTWLPIRPSPQLPPDQRTLDVSKLHFVDSGSGQILNRKSDSLLIQQSTFTLDWNSRRTGMISRLPGPGTVPPQKQLDEDAGELVILTRLLNGEDRVLVDLEDRFLPPYPESYAGLDQLVISGDQLLGDSAGLSAVRSWLARGGQMWIMLDRVSLDTVEALLGNAASVAIVDRIELTKFTLETPTLSLEREEATETWESELPVEFVRVLVDGAEIHSRIDGWPAAFSMPFGSGRVTFTALGPRGWMYEGMQSSDTGGAPAAPRGTRVLARSMQQLRTDEAFDPAQVTPLVTEQIGYRVPSRNLAGFILGLNCVVLAVAGGWFAKRQQLEHLAWAVPATVILSTGALVLIGALNSASVPATAATFQLLDICSETNEAHGTTLVALYSPVGQDLALESERSGSVLPDLTETAGVVKQAVWNDEGRGRWEGIRLPNGAVRVAQARENYVLTESIRALGQFGPQGLEGSLNGSQGIGAPADALLSFPPSPNTTVKFTTDNRFVCGEEEVLVANEYITGSLLSDEQQRRQLIYRQLLDPSDERQYPLRSTLFFWGQSNEPTIALPATFRAITSTLYAIPVRIQPTPRRSKFVVPSAFVRMENAGGQWGYSMAYLPREGKWREGYTATTDSMFRFVLPPQVLPCRIDRATIKLSLHAPSREVVITGWSAGQKVPIRQLESRRDVLEFAVDQPELLEVDSAGGLLFGVTVSKTKEQIAEAQREEAGSFEDDGQDRSNKSHNSKWQINYLRVQVAGETL
jgi:hypothetical protein